MSRDGFLLEQGDDDGVKRASVIAEEHTSPVFSLGQ
jgi:hypothetical protein